MSQLLSPATVDLNLQSENREGLFRELIVRIPGIKGRPEAQATLLRAVEEREEMHTTALGDGVAIPHARNAIPGLTDHAVIVFGRHSQGLEYGAVDGKPVRLVFLLIAPTISEHLESLASLSRLLRNAHLRRDLLKVGTPQEALARIRQAEVGSGG